MRCCWSNREETKPARPREAERWFDTYLRSIREGDPRHNYVDGETFNMFMRTSGIGPARARQFCRERGFDFDQIVQGVSDKRSGMHAGWRNKDAFSRDRWSGSNRR